MVGEPKMKIRYRYLEHGAIRERRGRERKDI
jgi:hypothetical protein